MLVRQFCPLETTGFAKLLEISTKPPLLLGFAHSGIVGEYPLVVDQGIESESLNLVALHTMADDGRLQDDDRLAALLATGRTVRSVAVIANVSERTLYRCLADHQFRKRVNAFRDQMVSQAVCRMSRSMTAAADALRELIDNPDPKIRLQAAKAMIEAGAKLLQTTDLAQEIDYLHTRADELLQKLEPQNPSNMAE